MSHDRWGADAEPYVLGALDAAERAAFEVHLRGCAECRRAVDDVAALPALLDQVPPELVAAVAAGAGLTDEAFRPDHEPPAVLLTDLLRVARREEALRRRRRWVAGGLAAAAVVAGVLVLPGSPVPVPWRTAERAPVVTEAIELSPVTETSVTASVYLDDVAWGTRIDLVCRHSGEPGDGAGGPSAVPTGPYGEGSAPAAYSLVVRDAEGGTEEVATWGPVPGREVTVPASTGLHRDEIVEVELRAADGTVLLAATT